jgi:hypothetical protein
MGSSLHSDIKGSISGVETYHFTQEKEVQGISSG